MIRHTMAASAVAQPHRNAVSGFPHPAYRANTKTRTEPTPPSERTSASPAANRNATKAEPVRIRQTTSSIATPDAEM